MPTNTQKRALASAPVHVPGLDGFWWGARGTHLDTADAPQPAILGRDEPRDEIPGAAREEVVRVLVFGFAEHGLPALEVVPGFVYGCAGEGGIACLYHIEHQSA